MYWGMAWSVGTQEPDGVWGMREHWDTPRGVVGPLGGIRGCQGGIGAGREYRYLGTRRGIGGIRGMEES